MFLWWWSFFLVFLNHKNFRTHTKKYILSLIYIKTFPLFSWWSFPPHTRTLVVVLFLQITPPYKFLSRLWFRSPIKNFFCLSLCLPKGPKGMLLLLLLLSWVIPWRCPSWESLLVSIPAPEGGWRWRCQDTQDGLWPACLKGCIIHNDKELSCEWLCIVIKQNKKGGRVGTYTSA